MFRSVAKLLLYSVEHIRGEKLYSCLKELEGNLQLSRDELKGLQSSKLKTLLDFTVCNNGYYKNKYKGLDTNGPFGSLPVLTKEELRDNFRNIVTCGKPGTLDLVQTSGSTGTPLRFYRDRAVFGHALASLYRAHRWWGLDVGCKEAMLWGVSVNLKGRIKARGKDFILNRFREKRYDITPETFTAFLQSIKRHRPDYIFGYSSMVYEFAAFLTENQVSMKPFALKAAICTAEKLHQYQRDLIEEALGCKVVSEYGSTEAGIISYECRNGSNHISDDCVYVEIVDEDNQPVPDGRSGRVLVTVLNSFASPIIRYDIGDTASKQTKACACGLNLSTMGEIEGRTSDVVIAPNGGVYHSIIFNYIIKGLAENYGGIKQFKIHQRKINQLEFQIVKSNDYRPEAESFIRKQIASKFGDSMNLDIIYLENIERRQSGKFKYFETDLDVSASLSQVYRNERQ